MTGIADPLRRNMLAAILAEKQPLHGPSALERLQNPPPGWPPSDIGTGRRYHRMPRRQEVLKAYHPSPSDQRRVFLRQTLGPFHGKRLNEAADLVDPLTPVADFAHRRAHGQPLGWEDAALAAGAALPVGGALAGKLAAKAVMAAGRKGRNVASKSANLYNPQDVAPKPQRPFEADYPPNRGAARHDGQGRLTHTIDGDEITGRYVVGRTTVGGSDVALPGEALNEIAKAGTGQELIAAPQSALGPKILGSVSVAPYTRLPTKVFVSNKLAPGPYEKVAAHEVGHVLDQIAGEIPSKGLSRELRPLYNTLNTGRERTRNLTEPKHSGYRGADIEREYMAEAIRSYMADPNYTKTVAPKTAARIRQHVNRNPRINRTVQFNSLAGGLLGLGALGIDNDR